MVRNGIAGRLALALGIGLMASLASDLVPEASAGPERAEAPAAPRSPVVVSVPLRSRTSDLVLVGGPDDPPAGPAGGQPVEVLPPVTIEGYRYGGIVGGTGTGDGGFGAPQRFTGSPQQLVGPNRQPVWTTHRPFANTRAYVIAPGQVEFESWWEGKFRKDDTVRNRFLQEVSIGLPHRFQVDLYWRVETETGEETRWTDFQGEVRYAFAPWGCLFLNPTVYVEWKALDDAPDVWETKLLFADNIGCKGQWALNFFFEEEVSGEHEREVGFSQAVSFPILGSCLSAGMEIKFESTTTQSTRGDPELELLVGPTFQWRPRPNIHLDIAPLFGCTPDSPTVQIWAVLGIDLRRGASQTGISAPTSARAR